MNTDTNTHRTAEMQSTRPLAEAPFEKVAQGIGRSVAGGIIERIHSFPARERMLFQRMFHQASLPEQILWDGLGEESAPIFVVYKLVHEAFSNAPQFFRSALVSFMRAQPHRFSSCFSRETIWAAMAAYPSFDPPQEPPLKDLYAALAHASKVGIWWRSNAEIQREAEALQENLRNGKFGCGFIALKALQSEKARGIACGKLLLAVPGRLAAYAQEVVASASDGKLPPLDELCGRVDEFARDREIDTRHESIPLDLLYTNTEDHSLTVRILARTKASKETMNDLRRRSLFIRYFLRKAFAGYDADDLDVKLALYLDKGPSMKLTSDPGHLFHPDEVEGMTSFWQQLCPAVVPESLFKTIRQAAASALQQRGVVQLLQQHFVPRVSKSQLSRAL